VKKKIVAQYIKPNDRATQGRMMLTKHICPYTGIQGTVFRLKQARS